MAINISVDFPGVEVIDATQPTSIVSPYGVAIILGSASTGDIRSLKLIPTLEEFTSIFGEDSPSEKYIDAFFKNLTNTSVRLYFYRVNDDDVDDEPLPPVAADYVTAMGATGINKEFNPGGLIIAPEAFETMNATDRKLVADAMVTFCTFDDGSLWLSIMDLSPTNTTITDAASDKTTNYVATRGQGFVFFPHYYNNANVLLVPSAALAAKYLSLWSSGRYYDVVAGSEFDIDDCNRLAVIVKKNERSTAHSSNINLIREFVGIGFAPDDSITLSSTKEYYHINSVVCFRIVAYILETEMEAYVHSSIKGNAEIITQVVARLNRVLNDALISGYLARAEGRPLSDAFTVSPLIETLPPPDNSVLSVQCAVRVPQVLQKIVIYLRNILGTV